jgi:hypothetical protein
VKAVEGTMLTQSELPPDSAGPAVNVTSQSVSVATGAPVGATVNPATDPVGDPMV